MRLVMTLLVRDEEDVLADHLEVHYSLGVDFVVATDNLSEDATPDILQHYADQGRLVWRRETDDDYAQAKWVTRMAREAATEHGADWVLNSDADEFWWPEQGTLPAYFAALPDDVGGVKVPRDNFVPVHEEDHGPFHQRMTVREVGSRNDRGKRILPKVAHRADPDVVVGQGNHRIESDALGPVVAAEGLEILHFPMRSYRQFENKIVKGGRAYGQHPERDRYGRIWQRLYERYLAGELEEYYASTIPSSRELAKGLRKGRYIEDTRLRDHLVAMRGEEPAGGQAGR